MKTTLPLSLMLFFVFNIVFSQSYIDIQNIDDVLTNSTDAVTVTITSSNPDGGDTSFSATSSNESVATVAISDTTTSGSQTTATLTVTHTGEGIATLSVIGSNPNSSDGGESFTYEADLTFPTGSLTYKKDGQGNNVTSGLSGDQVVITATFSEDLKENPIVQIANDSGLTATNMTKSSSTSYTYTWDIPAGTPSGDISFTLSIGTDSAGNVVASTPTSGQAFFIELVAVAPSGSGTEADPYQIASFANLMWMSTINNSGIHYIQINDIDASASSTLDSGQGFTPAQTLSNGGVYNGAGYTIDGLTINRPTTNSQGFFSSLNNGTIKNLGLTNVNITGKGNTGAIAGSLYGNSLVEACYGSGNVKLKDWMGGALTGTMRNTSKVKNCYSFIAIPETAWASGGMFGYMYDDAEIINCYNVGTTVGMGGTITGYDYTGDGIIATFFDQEVAGNGSKGVGLTTTEMKTATTFIGAGWDFVNETGNGTEDMWVIDPNGVVNNGYPYLSWQGNTNLSPSVVDMSAIDNVLTNSTDAVTVTITSSNPDGGDTSFSATSSNESVATVAVSDTTTSGSQTTATLTVTHTGEGIATLSVIGSNPNSSDGGESFTYEADLTFPTGSLTYKKDGQGNNVTSGLSGDQVVITATFSEDLKENPIVQIANDSGLTATNMTKSSSTSYTYTWDIPAGTPSGDISFTLSIGTDSAGNVVASTPTSGQAFFIELVAVAPSGSGTEADPYQIASFANLMWMSTINNSGIHYIQINDIDASASSTLDSGQGFTPAQTLSNGGVYNGAGYTIDGLTINRPTTNSQGFFSSLNNGTIKNLGLTNVNITGKGNTGAIAGSLYGNSLVEACYGSGNVKLKDWMGGALTGTMRNTSKVKNCYSFIAIPETAWASGGMFGYMYDDAEIINCYNVGTTVGMGGTITGYDYTGDGIIATFFDQEVAGNGSKGVGLTTTEMKTATTFIGAGWDFVNETGNGTEDMWVIDPNGVVNNGYPYLSWQGNTNLSPSVVDMSAIDNVLTNSTDAVTVTITSSNPDGGDTSFSATSSNESVATVAISDTTTSGSQTTATLTVTHTGEGIATLSVIGSNPNSSDGGESFTYEADLTFPTGSLTYKKDGQGNNVTSGLSGDQVVITATFSEDLKENPIVQIANDSGLTATNMTKSSSTSYTYTWDIPAGTPSGDISFTLSIGTDSAGNVVASTPTSGQAFFIEPIAVAPSGSGTEADPYQIASFANLMWMSTINNSGIHYIQINDIDASASSTLDSGQGFTPAQTLSNGGVYNGAGYTIDGLTINRPTTNSQGFFSSLNNGTIKNLGLTNVNITGKGNTGAIAGSLYGNSLVEACYGSGNVKLKDWMGGALTGTMRNTSKVKNCYSFIAIPETAWASGGMFGYMYDDAEIINCYNVGTTVGMGGTITGYDYTGDGIIATFFDQEVAGNGSKGVGLTTTEMKTATTFIGAGWDFVNETGNGTEDMWVIDPNGVVNNGYPYFNPDYFIVPDTTVPVITLVGDDTIILDLEAIYTDAGATAVDNVDGDITTSISVVNPVNTAIVGEYTVTYNVSDAAGNAAVQVTRTVNVVDTTVPVITLEGDAIVTIEVDAIYTDDGATALDNYDGDITTSISVVNPVNTAIVGEYTVTYNVSDAAGNAAVQLTRTVNVVDTTVPVITLEGDAIVTIEVDAIYTDDGATALDNYDGDITTSISVVNPVDTATVGEYTVTYNVSDAAGSTAVQVTRTVNVVDTTVPVITLEGDAIVTIEVDAIYTDDGATALDNYDGDITTSISVVNPVNTAIVGEYTVTYNVSDAAGNAAVQLTRTVNVVDTTVPVITLEGDAIVTIEVDAIYTDDGATALDNYDGDITTSISVVNPVDTATVGEYTVTYNVSDAAGNAAVQLTRTVNVVDTTVPVITLEGDAIVTIEVDAIYTDDGATALDNYDGDITTSISVVNPVNTAIVGEYTVTYNVSDAAGNAAVQLTRTVNVVDTTVPVITLEGDAIVTIEVDAIYTDDGATALDNYDGDITTSISVVNPVDTATVGEYTVTYNVSDAAGNAAVQLTRTVNVVDTTVPVITLEGDAIVTIEVDAIYTDDGATALDNYDGDITTSISVVNPVNTAIVGEYTVTYNVSDAAGNAAVQVTRTVNVVDTTVPVITLEGDAIVTIEVDAIYTDDGATALDNYDGDITTSISVVNPVNTAIVGEYTVTYNVSDAAGNAAVQLTRTVNVVETLGLDSTVLNKVSVYPNPTASKWTIESSRIIKTLTLFNLLGQKVLEQTANELKVNIDASNLKTGIYMLKVNSTIIKRVIKK